MKNNRSLFPPLFSEVPTGGGGGGSGNKIQLSELPEASLEYKDRIAQYTGETTEALTNGFFYKCVEHTTTEGEVITVTYSWDNIEVMSVSSGGKVAIATVAADGSTNYATLLNTLATAIQNIITTEKTYIMTVATANVCNIYNCVEISNNGIVFFNELISVSSTGVGSLNDIHYVLDFNGSSKYFYNGTAQGSSQTPSNNVVFTIYEI